MTDAPDSELLASAPRIFIGRLQASLICHYDQVERYDAEFSAPLLAGGGTAALIAVTSDSAQMCPAQTAEDLSALLVLHTRDQALVAAHRCLRPTIAALASVRCPPGMCSQMQGIDLDMGALEVCEGVVDALGQMLLGALADMGVPNPVEGLDDLREAFYSGAS